MEKKTVYTLVDVKDRLPEESDYYNCLLGDEKGLIHYHKDTGWQNGYHNDDVTHWLEKQTDVFIFTVTDLENIIKSAQFTAFGWGVELSNFDRLPELTENYLNHLIKY